MNNKTANKTACVTGITGQDGSYLAASLLSRGYRVIGLHRRSSTNNFTRVKEFIGHPFFELEEFDLTDSSSIVHSILKYEPKEFYNLAAQSHVGTSFGQPNTTFCVNTHGVINILEAIRNTDPGIRLYQASTSEMFGSNYTMKNDMKYQNEETDFSPQSPYAIAKAASHHMVRLYRESYGLYACSGILFNHESPKRGENFVTRKITKYIGQLVNGKVDSKLKLGNIESCRDWGHAKDYVEAMRMMLSQEEADDYVIATGQTYSVKHFLQAAFGTVGLDYQDHLEIDPDLYRPAEVDYLLGDAGKAKKQLGWTPQISFDNLVKEMVTSDVRLFSD